MIVLESKYLKSFKKLFEYVLTVTIILIKIFKYDSFDFHLKIMHTIFFMFNLFFKFSHEISKLINCYDVHKPERHILALYIPISNFKTK